MSLSLSSSGKVLDSAASAPATAERERLHGPDSVMRGIGAARYGRRDYLMRRLLALADAGGIMVGLLVAAQVQSRPELGSFLLLGAATLPVGCSCSSSTVYTTAT